jgi:hypothetical protein
MAGHPFLISLPKLFLENNLQVIFNLIRFRLGPTPGSAMAEGEEAVVSTEAGAVDPAAGADPAGTGEPRPQDSPADPSP